MDRYRYKQNKIRPCEKKIYYRHLFFTWLCVTICGLPWWLSSEESACQYRRSGFDSWIGKILWRRKCQPIPVFMPEKSLGQRMIG